MQTELQRIDRLIEYYSGDKGSPNIREALYMQRARLTKPPGLWTRFTRWLYGNSN